MWIQYMTLFGNVQHIYIVIKIHNMITVAIATHSVANKAIG